MSACFNHHLDRFTQKAAGVTSSLSKLELDRTKTTKLPRKVLPNSTPSSKNIAPPLNIIVKELIFVHQGKSRRSTYMTL